MMRIVSAVPYQDPADLLYEGTVLERSVELNLRETGHCRPGTGIL